MLNFRNHQKTYLFRVAGWATTFANFLDCLFSGFHQCYTNVIIIVTYDSILFSQFSTREQPLTAFSKLFFFLFFFSLSHLAKNKRIEVCGLDQTILHMVSRSHLNEMAILMYLSAFPQLMK